MFLVKYSEEEGMNERTVLNAVRAPLTLGDLRKNRRALSEELVDDTILSRLFKIFECMLQRDVSSDMSLRFETIIVTCTTNEPVS